MYIVIKRQWLRVAAALLVLALLGVFLWKVSGKQSGAAAFSRNSGGVTVVIDAGHGGEDGGAVSPSGINESVLNLAIAKRLEANMLLFGVPVIMTRESEAIEYPDSAKTVRARKQADINARVELVESIEGALLVSIHQNKFTSPQPFGAQAIYASTAGSRELAEAMQDSFILNLDPSSRRTATAAQSSIYLMNHVSCTAVLVECGFLSNPTDEAKLCTDTYQIKLSAIVAASIFCSGG